MPKVGELSPESLVLNWTEGTFNLTVLGYEGLNRRLQFLRLCGVIEMAKVVKKPNKLILTLTKKEEEPWASIAGGSA